MPDKNGQIRVAAQLISFALIWLKKLFIVNDQAVIMDAWRKFLSQEILANFISNRITSCNF